MKKTKEPSKFRIIDIKHINNLIHKIIFFFVRTQFSIREKKTSKRGSTHQK
jgi:hypothetical protein